MPEIEKTKPEDFPAILPLLEEFDNASIKRSDWERIFAYDWSKDEPIVGFHLEDRGRVVGFLGGIFSKRLINGQLENLCNLTSWIVREEFRNHSLALLLEMLKIQDHTFTNFSAAPSVSKVMHKFGFRELESGFRIVTPSFRLFSFNRSRKISIIGKIDYLRQRLKGDLRRILDDHEGTSLRPLLIEEERGQCLAFYKIVKRRRNIRAAYFLSASNCSILNDQIDNVMKWILLKHALLFLIIDERFVETNRLKTAKSGRMPVSMLFKSDCLQPSDIDYLYSEIALL